MSLISNKVNIIISYNIPVVSQINRDWPVTVKLCVIVILSVHWVLTYHHACNLCTTFIAVSLLCLMLRATASGSPAMGLYLDLCLLMQYFSSCWNCFHELMEKNFRAHKLPRLCISVNIWLDWREIQFFHEHVWTCAL